MRNALLASLRAARVVPVIRTASAAHAATAVTWLREAGLRIFELTMTTPGALDLLRELARDPAITMGMGTVPDADAARAALEAGASFLVTPWVASEVAAEARRAQALCMLGAMSPTEVRAALTAGADVVKVFPASSAGGHAHVKALVSVFPGVAFCPTGGVDPREAADYLAAGAAFVGIGGKLVDERAIARGDRATLHSAARDALAPTEG
jgi:2-dehydro-3-deoxyphosphogluconate aldolase/(4S)-4-hydroxy-2-oxoglutarate aldolase